MRISDWSSDVCSSDLPGTTLARGRLLRFRDGMVTIERSDWVHAPRPLHTDHLICAIGDVHGRADLLDPLLAALADDARVPGVAHATCIFLGALIDRGEQSRARSEERRVGKGCGRPCRY